MPLFNKFLLSLLLLPTALVTATLDGDEQYADILGGRFWAFHTLGVSIVNPETCAIEHTIYSDLMGDRLPRDWRDGSYIQTDRNHNGLFEGMLLMAAGSDADIPGADSFGEVVVFDTISNAKSPVISRIPVGGDPMYSYAVFPFGQFWTHSRQDGMFYVVDLLENDFLQGKTAGHAVKAKLQTSSQGQLFFHADVNNIDKFGNQNIGYATSEAEPFLFILHMQEHTQVGSFPFPNGTCTGAASMAYSHINGHLFVECHGLGGTLEFDVTDGENPLFVYQHAQITGELLETPDQVYVTATDAASNTMHFFSPSKITGTASVDTINLFVPDNPSYPSFLYSGTTYDYIACMPAMNQLDPSMPCGYFTTCPATATCPLVGDGFPEDPNADLYYETGVVCVDVKDALLGIKKEASLIRFAGGIRHTPLTSSPCTFAEPTRPHKRGARKYDASIGTLPINALQIIDMEMMTHKCIVPLQGIPKTVVYVPSAFHYGSPFYNMMHSDEGIAVGMLILIIILSVIATVVILLCTWRCVRRRQSGVEAINEKDIQQDLADAGIEMPANEDGANGHAGNRSNDEGIPRAESGELA